ncbi:MAG: cytochrome c biogenesis CcdA family protein [Methanosarcinales archaeon]|nr:cytochrome c biogenesis CcdA family protein [Methanosarcinales archaeon]
MEVQAPSLVLAFAAGLLTILTPCILPILPAVLAGSQGSRFRPITIVLGMSLSFTLMGGVISAVGSSIFELGEYLRWFAIFFITGMGAVMFDEDINNIYVRQVSRIMEAARTILKPLTSRGPDIQGQGMLGGFALGSSLGFMWIPCVGPILGSILLFASLKGNTEYGMLMLMVYSIGVGIPMLIIAYSGKYAAANFRWLMPYTPWFKKLSGLVLILVGLMILFGIDKMIQAALLPFIPPII